MGEMRNAYKILVETLKKQTTWVTDVLDERFTATGTIGELLSTL
jgi:hypothetical protein